MQQATSLVAADGITYSYGVFYDEWIKYFGEEKSLTALVSAILVGTTLCSGPVSSAFVNKYGCRPVAIAGSLIASLALIISAYANSVHTLLITAGLGTGLGFGLIYLPAIVSVTCYFERYRSLATGIAVCGSGFGTFILAPLLTKLTEHFGWRTCILCTGVFVLSCIFFGLLFRPLEEIEIPDSAEDIPSAVGNGEMGGTQQRPHSVHGHYSILPQNGSATTPSAKLFVSDKHLPTENAYSRLALSQPLLYKGPAGTGAHDHSHKKHKIHASHSNLKNAHSGVMYRKDVFYSGSTKNLHHDDTLICSPETKDTLNEMLDFSLFKEVLFTLFALSNFLTSNLGEERLVPRDQRSYLLAIVGIANTVGRVVLGYISDKPYINRLYIYNGSLTIGGIATILSAFCDDFWSLAVYCAVFGFTIGVYVGLTSVVLVDLIGLDKLTNAFGLLLLFQGIASFVGSPLAGFLTDKTGTYTWGFHLAGVCIALSGMMLFVVPSIQRRREKTKKLEQSENIAAEDCS
ncbi:unnamed protein product [Bemisia tabaci]|uniref:Major facilitator superfamily (MFS) profile domain-containing protein n=1 Tax=Bemisia tabaci TaxID=7038 RepID=A0A9P0F601_BEMTA|nr:unnamed protein product [Bemisia tabaci]